MRYRWVDAYRGIAVLFMVTLHFFVNIFPIQPISLLDYSIRGVVSIGDMALAFFLFISGVSAYFSISQSKKTDDEAVNDVVKRYSRIFIIGLFLDFILLALVHYIWWVLEAIGLAGLIAVFFMRFSDRMKLLAIAVIGLCYSYITAFPLVYSIASQFPNGGLLGSVPMSGIVLAGYMTGERVMKKKENHCRSFWLQACS